MADTINAGDENHTGRDARRENLRVMTCAAMHYAIVQLFGFTQPGEGRDQFGVHRHRRFVHPQIDIDADIHFIADGAHIVFQLFGKFAKYGGVRMPAIDCKCGFSRDNIDRIRLRLNFAER